MSTVFLATLGQRPEAITIALDRQLTRVRYEKVGILHTEPSYSGIAQALSDLRNVLARDYVELRVRYHELQTLQGNPILDLNAGNSADAYFDAVLEVLNDYRQDGWNMHLLVSGGRKAMSIYATIAASYLFSSPQDKVLTVLSPNELVAKSGQFHVSPGLLDQVQLVELPLRPARLLPGSYATRVLPERSRSARDEFLGKLSSEERRLCELLSQHPQSTNRQLGHMLHKSERTIENQLRSIYDKMDGHFDNVAQAIRKRYALVHLLLS